MKSYSILTVLVIIGTVNAASAEDISLDNGGISITIPDEFTELSQSDIDFKFPAAQPGTRAYGNKTQGTTIAFGISEVSVRPDQLDSVRQSLTATFDRVVPNIEWIRNETTRINSRECIILEMTSSAIDTDIHNTMVVTHYKGGLLFANFNSTKEEYPEYKSALTKSMDSLEIHDDEN